MDFSGSTEKRFFPVGHYNGEGHVQQKLQWSTLKKAIYYFLTAQYILFHINNTYGII
jgi:hypothetical protein